VATPNNYSVIKAFAILNAFRDSDGWLTSCELSQRANLPLATGYRLIQTMEKIGVIARGKCGQYRPGMRLFSIARNVPLSEYLREAGAPILTPLAVSFNLTTHVAVLQNGMVTHVGKYPSIGSAPPHARVGTQLEDYNSAIGKVLLAGLNRREVETLIMDVRLIAPTIVKATSPLRLNEELNLVRKRGFATDDPEPHSNTWCMAVPVQYSHGAVAAISASDEKGRMTVAREVKIKQALFEAAVRLQDVLTRPLPPEDCLSKDARRRAAKSRVKFRMTERRDPVTLREPGQEQAHCHTAQLD
jgi:IclR family acetate operon transcriptional repressor